MYVPLSLLSQTHPLQPFLTLLVVRLSGFYHLYMCSVCCSDNLTIYIHHLTFVCGFLFPHTMIQRYPSTSRSISIAHYSIDAHRRVPDVLRVFVVQHPPKRDSSKGSHECLKISKRYFTLYGMCVNTFRTDVHGTLR